MEFIREIVELIYMLRHWAWPIVFFIVFLIFIMMFKKQISEFLQRLKTLKIFGTVLETGIPPEQQVKRVKKSLPKSREEIGMSIKKKNAKSKLALKEYSMLLEKYGYEKSFNSIYGSQIDLLEHLLKKETLGEKYINLRNFYNRYYIQWKSKYTAKPTSMETYLEFLEGYGYIKYVGEGYERIVKITQRGNDFLSYIKDQYPAGHGPLRYF